MRAMMSVLPWFLPGVAVAIGVGLAFGSRVGRMLGTRPLLGWALILSLGVVLSATLTPRNGPETGSGRTSSCDFERIGPAAVEDLLVVNDTSLNVLLFVPLGVTIGAIPRPRRMAILLVGAAMLPFAIEWAQLLAPDLNRACETADIADNLTGLAAGLVVGILSSRVVGSLRTR
jgi:hypothetical protein